MKRFFGTQSAVLRHVALLGTALVVAVLSCGREPTAPSRDGASGVRYARGLSFRPVFPPAYQAAGGSSSGLVPFDRVRIVLRRADGAVALDTVVTFPAGTDSLTVSLTVSLLPSAPATGELLAMNLGYVNAAGDTVFRGGPVTVTAAPRVPGAPAPPSVSIPVRYTGPGSTAARVIISPRSLTIVDGNGFNFTALATDAGGTTIPNTPIIWASLDPAIATITAPAASAGTALNTRGTARIVAQLLTGPSDQVTVQVTLRARNLAALSGSGQSGTVGTSLAQPLVAKVSASDGVGVQGVAVSFAITSGGGSVGSAAVTTDAAGLAQTTWTLGPTVGAQTVTASAAGLTGSPVIFSATGIATVPTRLVVTTQPVSTTAGATMAPVVFTAKDALNTTTTAFIGPVTVALGANPGLATLGGTTTVNAVAGVATFSTLTVNRVSTGYTLVGSSPGLLSATTTTFDISAGAGRRLEFSAYPVAGAIAGATIDPITVLAKDTSGNLAPSFTGVVTLGLGASPTGATISGRTTANAVNGVATFDSVRLTRAGSYQFTASATGLTSVTGPAFNLGAGAAAGFTLVSGGGQTAAGGTSLAQPVVVQVRDAFGNPVAGAGRTVTFAASAGGSATPPSATTNAAGQVSTTWTLGATVGAQTLTASSAGLGALTVGATATTPVGPGPPTTLTISGGNGQSAFTGQLLPTPLRVTVTNALATGVPGVTVTWAAVMGGGSVSAPTSVTDTSGVATITWTLGATPGAQTATATVTGLTGSPATFTANAIAFTFASLTAGAQHTCGLTAGGPAYCWGDNGNGQLGDGTTTRRLTPTPVAGGVVFASLTAGTQHTCGLTAGGAAYCWGFNNNGQLGDGTTTNRSVPTPVIP